MPKDHTSEWNEYLLWLNVSGAYLVKTKGYKTIDWLSSNFEMFEIVVTISSADLDYSG